MWSVPRNRFVFLLKVSTNPIFRNLTSLRSEFAQAEPMEDLVRSSRWGAWVMDLRWSYVVWSVLFGGSCDCQSVSSWSC